MHAARVAPDRVGHASLMTDRTHASRSVLSAEPKPTEASLQGPQPSGSVRIEACYKLQQGVHAWSIEELAGVLA